MTEQDLEQLFKKFLYTKGYQEGNLVSQKALKSAGKVTFRPDLLLLDIENQEYIAIIEFKSAINRGIEVSTLGQIYRYFGRLGSREIPAYIVFPVADDDFQILSLSTDNEFVPINKEDFPSFETLSAKKLTDEKLKRRENEEIKLFEQEQKKQKAKLSSYLALSGLLVGLITSIFLMIYGKGDSIDRSSSNAMICCDSLQSNFQKIDKRIADLESKLHLLSIDTARSIRQPGTVQLTNLDKRIKTIEDGVSTNPEKTLALLEVKRELDLLKKSDDFIKDLNQSKIDALKSQIDLQNGWVIGIAIAIFASILAIWLPNIIPRRNGTTTP
jgi:F0F1-type ATP synthase assembly protein I